MPAALLDTNGVSDLMRDHPRIKARIANYGEPIVTSVVVVGDMRYGLDRLVPAQKRTDLELRAGTILASLRIEPLTEPIARVYGNLKASLESQGHSIDDNDLWIAATASTLGYVLVTRDQVFAQIPGLQVTDWTL